MIYAISDLHGLPLDTLKQLLKKVNFSDKDWLYILGDVIDRNNGGGVEILLWLLEQPNVQLILGNHEAMLLSCDFVFEEITTESIESFTQEKMEFLLTYTQNGGDVTLTALKNLMKTDPYAVGDILDYLRDAPLYETVSAGDNDFLLVHSGLGNFEKAKKISSYTADDLLWTRPDINEVYFDNVITVFGHTPTIYYGDIYNGKIIRTKTWINIDVGISSGNSPVLLRLDDLKEFKLNSIK